MNASQSIDPVAAFLAVAFMLGITLLFAGTLCGVCLLIAPFGWRRLSFRWRTAEKPEGRRLWPQSSRIGPVGYNNCILVRFSDRGLFLSVIVFFRAGHPTVLIPWDRVRLFERKWWVFRADCLEIFDEKSLGWVTIPRRAIDWLPSSFRSNPV